jgi:hypothetical protein
MRILFPTILMMFSELITRQNSPIFKINKLNISGFDGESITIKSKFMRLESFRKFTVGWARLLKANFLDNAHNLG